MNDSICLALSGMKQKTQNDFEKKEDRHERITVKIWMQPESETVPHFYGGWFRSANPGAERPSGLYQFSGCLHGLAAGKGAERGDRSSGGDFFQTCFPAGAAVGLPLDKTLAKIYWVDDQGELSPLASAYARARGADRMSSFGDFIALSDVCDRDTAMLIKREVSDGVIAPGYTEEALEILKQKKKGNYNVIQIDANYHPAPIEHKQVFGVTFEQGRQELPINDELLSNFVTEKKTFRQMHCVI